MTLSDESIEELLLRRELIGLSKPKVAELKTKPRTIDGDQFASDSIRIHLPDAVQEAITRRPWRLQLLDFERYQGKMLHTRLFTRFIEASLLSKEEPVIDKFRVIVEISTMETLLETHLLPRSRQRLMSERDVVRKSDDSWAIAPNNDGVSDLGSMRATATAAHMKQRVLRFDYWHSDGRVVTRRVKVRRWSKSQVEAVNKTTRVASPITFLAERHGKIRNYRFDRCSNMYLESISVKKLEDELELTVEPDGNAAVLALKLAAD